MNSANPSRGWTAAAGHSPVVLVTRVGAAAGSRAAAAALACAASEPDRAVLLIDLDGGRAPRPSLIATAGARELEERLVAHLLDAGVASRGQFCHLTLPADSQGLERVAAALPLVRESAAVVHLAPSLMRPLLDGARIRPTAALLRADLVADHALTALAVRDLMAQGMRLAVLKRPLSRLVARAALLGALPSADAVLSVRLRQRLLHTDDSKFRRCYDGRDESGDDQQETPQQEGSGLARAQWWKAERPEGQGRA